MMSKFKELFKEYVVAAEKEARALSTYRYAELRASAAMRDVTEYIADIDNAVLKFEANSLVEIDGERYIMHFDFDDFKVTGVSKVELLDFEDDGEEERG